MNERPSVMMEGADKEPITDKDCEQGTILYPEPYLDSKENKSLSAKTLNKFYTLFRKPEEEDLPLTKVDFGKNNFMIKILKDIDPIKEYNKKRENLKVWDEVSKY